jgi:short-subunit dehydrogenase
MKKPVLIVGATSSIARAIGNALAKEGYPLFLASRDEEELQRISSDISIRYNVEVQHGFFDVDHMERVNLFFQQVLQKTNGLEGIVYAIGDIGQGKNAINEYSEAEKIIKRNYLGACAILTLSAQYLEKEKRGFIIGISDDESKDNYVYGSAKAGLTVFLKGLRDRLSPTGVRVLTVLPGLVDTALTFGARSNLGNVSPKYVGEKTVKALIKRKNVIYLSSWKWISNILNFIPEKHRFET